MRPSVFPFATSNALIVSGTEEARAVLESLINELDSAPEQEKPAK